MVISVLEKFTASSLLLPWRWRYQLPPKR